MFTVDVKQQSNKQQQITLLQCGKMNIYKKPKNGGPVKIDKDFCPRNRPKKSEIQLFHAFDVFKHGHFVPNQVV